MTAQELIDLVERLFDDVPPDYERWLRPGGLWEQALSVEPAISDAFWHSLNHYVNDGDIRARDAVYKDWQDAKLRNFLGAYKELVRRSDS
jgi:hypothetical protein